MKAAGTSRQRGATTPIAAASVLLLAVIGAGGATIGRIAVARSDAQRAADAAALALGDAIREQGIATSPAAALGVGQRNVRTAVGLSPAVNETTTSAQALVEAHSNLLAPRFVFASGTVDVAARARAMVPEVQLQNVAMPHAKVVLVLDFSGSMVEVLAGGQSKIDELKSSVAEFLREPLRIDWAGVLFSTDVLGFQPFAPDAASQLQQLINNHSADGSTATERGLAKARDLLAAPDVRSDPNKFVLLVSDGAPNDVGSARGAAGPLWDLGATIITLHIDSDGDAAASQFMLSVSGKSPGNDHDWYFRIDTAAALEAQLQTILARIGCPLDPLPPVENPPLVSAFLRPAPGASERKLVNAGTGDLALFRDREAFRYDPATRRVTLSLPACEAIANRHEQLVIRYNRARLIE
jgi:hypothetical protein